MARLGQVPGDRLAIVGDEVLSVARLLAKQPRLRRALTDPAGLGEDRAALIGSLVAGKVIGDTEDLLRVLVNGRWSSGTDLLDAMERLGAQALLGSAEAAGELADVEDELFRFGQVVDGNDQLAATLGSSSAPVDGRKALARSLLEGKARPATVRLAELAVDGFGGRNFATGLTKLVELAAERREREIAYVTVAAPLSEADEHRLADRLSQIYGRAVELKITVEPQVLGGMKVKIGYDLYDGTVLRRLTETRTALARRR
jgi:F-type H+-transporting ATPase subunit delta